MIPPPPAMQSLINYFGVNIFINSLHSYAGT